MTNTIPSILQNRKYLYNLLDTCTDSEYFVSIFIDSQYELMLTGRVRKVDQNNNYLCMEIDEHVTYIALDSILGFHYKPKAKQ